MEQVLRYYEFSPFMKDESQSFDAEIAFTSLNSRHFLIFEQESNLYNLYVAEYESIAQIGKVKPKILELLVRNYDKSNPEHRILLRQYFE